MSKGKAKRRLIDEIDREAEIPRSKRNKISIGNKGKSGKLIKPVIRQPRNLVKHKHKVKNCQNSNAIPVTKTKTVEVGVTSKELFKPIIQTRKMKASKAKLTAEEAQKELDKLNLIDNLTSVEIADGSRNFESDDEDINHDGVELLIHGSDFEEEEQDDGEIVDNNNVLLPLPSEEYSDSDGDEPIDRSAVRSKVFKVRKGNKAVSCSNDSTGTVEKDMFGKFEHLKHDPEFRDFLNEILDDRDCCDRGRDRTRSVSRGRSNDRHGKHGKSGRHSRHDDSRHHEKDDVTPKHRRSDSSSSRHGRSYSSLSSHHDKGIEVGKKNEGSNVEVNEVTVPVHSLETTTDDNNRTLNQPRLANGTLVKSPSDTTTYSPGLRKAVSDEISVVDKISNFIEGIRLGNNRRSSEAGDTRQVEHGEHSRSWNKRTPDKAADRLSDQLVLQAEKFKAKIEAPKGNYTEMLMPYDYDKLQTKFIQLDGLAPVDKEILFLHNFDQDDEFFHVTSQIEPALRSKIERGEYIDLERLLPKDRSGRGGDDLNKQLFQLITQGTNSYLEPPNAKGGKINSVRKWDQAFRVYAAIYTHANPSRASEIWQYVYVIHTAASANPWDNVYYYDINFRELMASKPWRSWGKT